MKKFPKFWGLAAKPSRPLKIILITIPFIVCISVYLLASHIRHIDNPQDKILPTFSQMGDAVYRMAFQEDQRTGKYLMLTDTVSSLRRLLIGITVAALLGHEPCALAAADNYLRGSRRRRK